MHLTSSQRAAYNSLLDVSDADGQITTIGKEACLDKLLGIIGRRGAEREIGIRLLHKHNLINDGEIMVAEPVFDNEGFAIAAHPIQVADVGNDVVVASWQLSNEGFIPSEFSRGKLVRSLSIEEGRHDDLFRELAAEIRQLDVAELLGPCLNMSDWVQAQTHNSSDIMLERTDFENRANVSRFVGHDEMQEIKSRETTWQTIASAPDDSEDPDKVVKTCKCACSVSTGGGHLGTHVYLGH